MVRTITLLVVIIGTMSLTVNNKLLLISILSETTCYYCIYNCSYRFVCNGNMLYAATTIESKRACQLDRVVCSVA